VKYHTPQRVGDSFSYQAYDAGHMLGSSSVVLDVEGNRLIFSGDVGRVNLSMIR